MSCKCIQEKSVGEEDENRLWHKNISAVDYYGKQMEIARVQFNNIS